MKSLKSLFVDSILLLHFDLIKVCEKFDVWCMNFSTQKHSQQWVKIFGENQMKNARKLAEGIFHTDIVHTLFMETCWRRERENKSKLLLVTKMTKKLCEKMDAKKINKAENISTST